MAHAADTLFISGTSTQPTVTLNNTDRTADLKRWRQGRESGWILSLTDELPSRETIEARLELFLD